MKDYPIDTLLKWCDDQTVTAEELKSLVDAGLVFSGPGFGPRLSELGRTLALINNKQAKIIIDKSINAPLMPTANGWVKAPDVVGGIKHGSASVIGGQHNITLPSEQPKVDTIPSNPGNPMRGVGTEPKSAKDVQIGGDHYKALGQYQPWQVLAACMTPEELRGFMKGTVISYLMRERSKGGDSDVAKALHTMQLFEELRKDK